MAFVQFASSSDPQAGSVAGWVEKAADTEVHAVIVPHRLRSQFHRCLRSPFQHHRAASRLCADGNADAHADADPNANADAHPDAHAYEHADAHAYEHANQYTDIDTDRHPDAHTDEYLHQHPNVDEHPDEYADEHAD